MNVKVIDDSYRPLILIDSFQMDGPEKEVCIKLTRHCNEMIMVLPDGKTITRDMMPKLTFTSGSYLKLNSKQQVVLDFTPFSILKRLLLNFLEVKNLKHFETQSN